MRILGLRSRIFILLGILVAVNLTGALVTLWYVQRTQALFSETMEQGAEALDAAQEMQRALLSQRGYVSYFFMDGDESWLERLAQSKDDFEMWWRTSFDMARTKDERNLLFAIESEYVRYSVLKERVINIFRQGDRQRSVELHAEARQKFFQVNDLCRQFKQRQKKNITSLIEGYRTKFKILSWLAWSAIPAAAILGLLLAILIMRRVLAPIHRLKDVLSNRVDKSAQEAEVLDEVEYLGDRIQILLKDVGQAQDKLAKSREDLLQAEKLATIGKLAAGVAHSVRNPLTSVKMRLFTLERSLPSTPETREDLDVISEEIDFIDTILKNFLEFSRPPKLKPQPLSLSSVVDQTLQLLRHKLESMHIDVTVHREKPLPVVLGDPDQLKEVLVNLLINGMEAMGEGGAVTITEEEGVMEPYGRVAIVRVADNGPGLPHNVRAHLFEPFVSTKEDGTGLGLAISKRIVEEHGGWLHATSETGRGATFVIGLPRMEAPA
ncbi:histidine kinase [Oceanidesulfovibrio indonesiensis]|uniref:histidine kinase n=1 Tax=Oceanidesulfovibrio indonesiensis TaxID=54767 RepID=A0A7M3MFK5_9BACT|nr:ATP-binding protein [Oceanidesulfovibrio indonesiensis]TVM17900.1 histidine kinase [Oceanidesulfovibrio indonesiensis]